MCECVCVRAIVLHTCSRGVWHPQSNIGDASARMCVLYNWNLYSCVQPRGSGKRWYWSRREGQTFFVCNARFHASRVRISLCCASVSRCGIVTLMVISSTPRSEGKSCLGMPSPSNLSTWPCCVTLDVMTSTMCCVRGNANKANEVQNE